MLIRVLLSRPAAALTGAEFAHGALMGIARANVALVQQGVVPLLYRSGVVYRREPPGVETFADALTIYQQKHGDCSSLAAWRVGELIAAGEKATIYIRWREYGDNGRLYHVMARRENQELEDPSRMLGM